MLNPRAWPPNRENSSFEADCSDLSSLISLFQVQGTFSSVSCALVKVDFADLSYSSCGTCTFGPDLCRMFWSNLSRLICLIQVVALVAMCRLFAAINPDGTRIAFTFYSGPGYYTL